MGTSTTIFIIDRDYGKASSWMAASGVFSAVGLIHQGSMDLTFKHFLTGGQDGSGNFETSPCAYCIGYLSVGVFLGVVSKLTELGYLGVEEVACEKLPVRKLTTELGSSSESDESNAV